MPMGNSLLKGLSALAGIGGLVFSYFLLAWPGMTDRQIAQPVSMIQMDPVARAVQLTEQTVQQTEQAVQLSQRACVMKNPDYLSFMFKGLSNYYHYFPLQEQEKG